MLVFPEKDNTDRWLKKRARAFSSQAELKSAVSQLIMLRHADIAVSNTNIDQTFAGQCLLINERLSNVPFYTQGLEIKGGDVAKKLGQGRQVGQFLSNLLDRIIAGQLKNNKESLASALERRAKRIGKTS